MDNQAAVYADEIGTERDTPYRLTAKSPASVRIAALTAPCASWTLPSGDAPLGYLPRQVLHPVH